MKAMAMTHSAPVVATQQADRRDERSRQAARAVAGFMTGFLAVNTYWSLGGRWGVAWVLGCDCTVPLPAVWAQEVAIVAGIGVVLARAGLWRPPLPAWIFRTGTWTMAATFAAVGLQNLLGDNTVQARFVFTPTALALSALCIIVARARR